MTTTDPRAAIVGRITAGLTAAGASADMEITPEGAAEAAQIVAQQIPTAAQAAALEPLWPQLVRYGVSILGTAMAARGIGEAADWQALGGALIAVAPILYRICRTMIARRAITGA